MLKQCLEIKARGCCRHVFLVASYLLPLLAISRYKFVCVSIGMTLHPPPYIFFLRTPPALYFFLRTIMDGGTLKYHESCRQEQLYKRVVKGDTKSPFAAQSSS